MVHQHVPFSSARSANSLRTDLAVGDTVGADFAKLKSLLLIGSRRPAATYVAVPLGAR
jgi:hypothetical protein